MTPSTPPASGRATMHDVATHAGVSLKSVSRVVNDEPGVSAALGERVRRAVAELGYRHNLAASNLRRGRATGAIGMLVQDVSNGFCAEALRAVEDRARERGIVVMAASSDEDGPREREVVAGLVARRVDGLLLMPTSPDLGWLAAEIDAGLPVVAVDRRPAVPEIDAVVVDNRGASAEAVGHLVAHGHRRVAHLGDDSTIITAAERLDGYRSALRATGVVPDPALELTGLRSREAARDAVLALLDLPDPPTALFAARNVICEGAVLALQQRGLTHRVALVGFDDLPVAEMLDPGITVVTQNPHEIGTRAIDLLLRRLDGDTSTRTTEVVPTSLIRRGSGEIAGPDGARAVGA
ncbi:LacI family DNA-binding transcriptional regulator [Nocardioides aurantiacus]|uniref:LacI family transcriptional regulator n=1 Tax=Nocardioides aurantiacus TaxID=86796 RepID=A0A3N2CUU6_9ACTN|nr:LacI family DNA-binding transcriptional regulator [Nocardioides aurantiacus]ROR91315.1 LacI family transcriptional regulator [Nocardioides aurantiacus]